MTAPIERHHAEWLSLVETSGPFLSVPVLSKALPQGLDAPDSDVTARLRSAREQLDDDASLHRSWCNFVLREVLELDETLAVGAQIPAGQEHRLAEQGDTVRPDLVVIDYTGGAPKPVMHITIHSPGQRLDRRIADAAWSASPIDRIAALCRATGVSLGLATDGRSWALVSARPGETTGVCTWDADLWLEEPITLRAFRTLLGAHRFFSVAEDDTLPMLLEQSARNQQEVTDRLGAQVRQAVELLIDALDRADHDRKGELLGQIPNEELYRAAVTMMMRLVFLFVAEERRLLPLDDPLYAESYAASALREQLEERATKFGEDPLERSSAAWYRLLALSRAVHGGIDHEALRLPAYGGGLFDPDRYPFLEGRGEGTDWQEGAAAPLPVDDRTVLHLLTALQVLTERGRAGQPPTSVRLSFRALDVEQIGHVYEGLLDHTAVRTFDAALGLVGPSEEEIALGELEALREQPPDVLARRLVELKVKSGQPAVSKVLSTEPEPDRVARLSVACDNDTELRDRVLPFLGVVRDDLRGYPRVFLPGSLYVTKTVERRSSGTYYTPRSLAEEVVQHALDPVAYCPGPADDPNPAKWELKPANELLALKVVDMAMGSGAFLVAACRYLAARILEAWGAENAVISTPAEDAAGQLEQERLPIDPLEREVLAHRLVAERCLYGVDKNPMAVEMAKLSLWLVTLAKDRPFSFLDHALREGDSLLGVTSLDQVRAMHFDPARGRALHENLLTYTRQVGPAVDRALSLREELEAFVVRDVKEAQRKAELHEAATEALADVRLLADVVVGTALAHGGGDELDSALVSVEGHVQRMLESRPSDHTRLLARQALSDASERWLQAGRVPLGLDRHCFHWALEFPEVIRRGGFDAVVGNPPFLGNKYWKGYLGRDIQSYFEMLLEGSVGKPDLVVVFLARAVQVLKAPATFGMLATQSITEVDSRRILERNVLASTRVVRAVSSSPWPGSQTVVIAKVWGRRGHWTGGIVLDDQEVEEIGADLRLLRRGGEPKSLVGSLAAFEGVHNGRGQAFILESSDPLVALGESGEIIKPYISGTDLAAADPREPARCVIDLTGRAEDRLGDLPATIAEFVETVVRPTRSAAALSSYRGLAERWWTFWNTRETLLWEAREIGDTCIGVGAVAKYIVAFELPSSWVFTNKVFVFPARRADIQAIVLSGLFDLWLETFGGTMGGETRVMKGASVVATFPPPPELPLTGANLGPAWQTAIYRCLDEGFAATPTDVLNRVHDEAVDRLSIIALREISRRIDIAVIEAYGWDDLKVTHGFCEGRHGIRFSIQPQTRSELLTRLLALNVDVRSSEEAVGLHGKKKTAPKTALNSSAQQVTIFGDD